RLTSSRDRTKKQVEAELDFITYLHRGGVNAMRPVASFAGQFIEEISFAGDILLATVFEEAKGEPFRYNSGNLNKDHFKLRGRTLGRIHALSKDYAPSTAARRFAWDEDRLLLEAADFLPDSEKTVWRAYYELKERLHAFPKLAQTYELIQ